MIQLKTLLDVADNTGARKASFIGVLKSKNRAYAKVGDMVRANVKECAADSAVKKGTVVKGIVVRTKSPIRRPDGTYVRFDTNAIVIIDDTGNPKGTRVFGPIAREIRNLEYMKIVSLAPEVV